MFNAGIGALTKVLAAVLMTLLNKKVVALVHKHFLEIQHVEDQHK
jgi:hypothetical protein